MAEIGDELEINDWLLSGRIDMPTPDTLEKYITISLNEGDLLLLLTPNNALTLSNELSQYVTHMDKIKRQETS